jgi:fermentation-respiration switch protein FrsA (DUF1100 family)
VINISDINYSSLDIPQVLAFLFHPRPEVENFSTTGSRRDVIIPVEDDINIGAAFHAAGKSSPTILFFHGNGEIVSDYDDIGMLYNKMNVNFFPVDYRGYGKSTGSPTVTAMMRDSHRIFRYIKDWLSENQYSGSITIMGRSLGSAPALEIAEKYQNELSGLIIESGFAYCIPLLNLLGIDVEGLGISEGNVIQNVEKIRRFRRKTLIIHAQFDHIIPFSDGMALFNACASSEKGMIEIKGADHNTIFYHGMQQYMQAVKRFVHGASGLDSHG